MKAELDGFEWWAEYLGRYLMEDGQPPLAAGLNVPTRTKKGIADMRLGAIDAQYAVTKDHAILIGRIELPSTEHLTVLRAEDESGTNYLAKWLIEKAETPFMVGNISLANPSRSMQVSTHGTIAMYCEAGKNFSFDLEKLRAAHKAFAPFDWPKVSRAIYLAQDARTLTGETQKAARMKLSTLFQKNEGLMQAITSVDIKARGGEHILLGWSRREKKTK